jgi:hypothetical protein
MLDKFFNFIIWCIFSSMVLVIIFIPCRILYITHSIAYMEGRRFEQLQEIERNKLEEKYKQGTGFQWP